MDAGAKFCPKCGTAAVGTAQAAATPTAGPVPAIPAAPPAQSSSALKIVLIVVAVVVGLGILGVGTLGFVAHQLMKHSRVETKNGNVKVDTPFGTVETTQDPNQAAQNVGVDIYPGATLMKEGNADVTFGSVHSSAAQFESDDPPATVADFYKSKFPGGTFTSSGNSYTILAGDRGNMTTITIQPQNGKTRIHVAKVTTKATGN